MRIRRNRPSPSIHTSIGSSSLPTCARSCSSSCRAGRRRCRALRDVGRHAVERLGRDRCRVVVRRVDVARACRGRLRSRRTTPWRGTRRYCVGSVCSNCPSESCGDAEVAERRAEIHRQPRLVGRPCPAPAPPGTCMYIDLVDEPQLDRGVGAAGLRRARAAPSNGPMSIVICMSPVAKSVSPSAVICDVRLTGNRHRIFIEMRADCPRPSSSTRRRPTGRAMTTPEWRTGVGRRRRAGRRRVAGLPPHAPRASAAGDDERQRVFEFASLHHLSRASCALTVVESNWYRTRNGAPVGAPRSNSRVRSD